MDCYSFDRIISDYIDADLNVKLRQEANEHISVCPHCKEKLADMKAILAAILYHILSILSIRCGMMVSS